MGERLGGREAHPQPGERPGPGPDHDARRGRRRDVLVARAGPRSGRGAPPRGGSPRPRCARARGPSPSGVAEGDDRARRRGVDHEQRAARRSRGGLEVPPVRLVAPSAARSRRGSSPVPVDHDVQPGGRERGAEPLRPLDERDARRLPLVEQPARERVRGVVEPVEVEVEQRQPALRTRTSARTSASSRCRSRRGPPRTPWRAASCPRRGRRAGTRGRRDARRRPAGRRGRGSPAGVVVTTTRSATMGIGHRSEGSPTHPWRAAATAADLRQASGEALEVPDREVHRRLALDRHPRGLEPHVRGEPPEPDEPHHPALDARRSAPPRTWTQSGSTRRRARRPVRPEHQRRRIDEDRRPREPASRSRIAATGVGIAAPHRALEHEDAERRRRRGARRAGAARAPGSRAAPCPAATRRRSRARPSRGPG